MSCRCAPWTRGSGCTDVRLPGAMWHLSPRWRQDTSRLPPHLEPGTPTPGVAPEHAISPHSPGVTGSDTRTPRRSSHTLHTSTPNQIKPENKSPLPGQASWASEETRATPVTWQVPKQLTPGQSYWASCCCDQTFLSPMGCMVFSQPRSSGGNLGKWFVACALGSVV